MHQTSSQTSIGNTQEPQDTSGGVDVRGHHSPPPITPATADSPRYVPPHKRPNHRQLLETRL